MELVNRQAVSMPLQIRDALLVMFGFGTPWSSGGSKNQTSSAAWRADVFHSCWQHTGVNDPLFPGVGQIVQMMMSVQVQLLRRESFLQLIGIARDN